VNAQGDLPSRTTPPNGPTSGTCVSRGGAAMHLLACGVPLSLIMDLAIPGGPHSQEILDVEGYREDSWWEPSWAEPN
jgi:hypothetical protein